MREERDVCSFKNIFNGHSIEHTSYVHRRGVFRKTLLYLSQYR